MRKPVDKLGSNGKSAQQVDTPSIDVPGGRIALDLATLTWRVVKGAVNPTYISTANYLTSDHKHRHDQGPQNGQPGFELCHDIAKALGGKPVLPLVPPAIPGAVY